MTEIPIPVVSDDEDARKEVVFTDPFDSEYGQKVCVKIPDDGYETMMDLKWDRTHRQWDPARKAWTIDFDAFGHTVAHWLDEGRSVAVTESCVDELESI